MEPLHFKLLSETAQLPKRAHPGDAGFDLYAAEGERVTPGYVTKVSTDVAVALPYGTAGLISPRSGLAASHGLQVLGGVIDAGYRGALRVILTSVSPLKVNPGDRIAQLLVMPLGNFRAVEAETLPDSARADGGFGSTGR